MNRLLTSMIPDRARPLARRIYRTVFDSPSAFRLPAAVAHVPEALKCTVSYNRYGGYCVPFSSRHRPAARMILSNQVYEPETIEFMTLHCGDGDVVHAGTYFGDFLPPLSRALANGSRIWAFEPNRENYRCTRITLEINGIENVVLTNAGLGATQEHRRLRTVDESGRALGGGSRIVPTDTDDLDGTQQIRIVTVDDVVGTDRTVSILQLDVEGHEQEALAGALTTIQRCRPILILEVLPGSTLIASDWFADNVLRLGYRKTRDLHVNTAFACAGN